MPEVRQRVPRPSKFTEQDDTAADAKTTKTTTSLTPTGHIRAEDRSYPFTLIEIARTITLLFIISGALSYFVTKNDLFWGHRPAFTKPGFWQDLFRRPLYLTPGELARYDGSNPALPIYLAINGTIYDVSPGVRHYGPGGSYHSFAGADATRAFVTGCFADDVTPDLRGAELMYLPVDDPEIDGLWSKGQLKALKEQEKRFARSQLEKDVKKWVDFFKDSDKYRLVGFVQRDEPSGEPLKLCKAAMEGRPKRRRPDEKPEKGMPLV